MQPRNVTPGASSGEPEWAAWRWANRGRGFPWLGVLLVLIGVGLLVQYVFPAISTGTLVLLAIGLAFVASWLFGGSYFASIPGWLLVGLAVAQAIPELSIYEGPGTTALCLAVAFAVLWLIGYLRQRRGAWALWGVAIFGLIGLAQVSGDLANVPQLGVIAPLVIILLGVLLLFSARR
jgi:hypothetical protein